MRWSQHYHEERRSLASLYYLKTRTGRISPADVLCLTRYLSNCEPDDSVLAYLFITLLSCIDDSYFHPQQATFFQDVSWVKNMHRLVVDPSWKCPGAGAAAQLAWTLALISVAQDDIRLQTDDAFSENELERILIGAIRADALIWLRNTVLVHKHDDWQQLSTASLAVDPAFASEVTDHLEKLVEAFISLAFQLIRRMKNKEEDALSVPHPRLRSRRSHARLEEQAPQAPPRHDVEDLFSLIALLYKYEPDRAAHFWGIAQDDSEDSGGNLRSFIEWASEVRTPTMIKGFFTMLESLSTGPICADEAHRFLFNNPPHSRASYAAFFGAIYRITGVYESQGSGQNVQVPPDEWLILIPFCHCVAKVLRYSHTARAVIYIDSQFRATQTLFSIIGLPIDLFTKGAVLDTIAAFAASDKEPPSHSSERKRNLWFELEKSRVLDFRSLDSPGHNVGIMAELEQIEEPGKQYPASTALVDLLAALSKPSTPSNSTEITIEGTGISDIPETLGAEYRRPGVDPYVAFVVDGVFLKAPLRPFANQNDKWKVLESCLNFLDTCLEGLTFSSFLAAGEIAFSDVQHVISQPGFDIFLRILSGSPCFETLSHIASTLLDDLESDVAKTPLFKASVKRTLNIFHKVLHLQPVFLEVVQPLLLQGNVGLPTPKMNMLRSAVGLDSLFLSQPQEVVRIATLVNCTVDDQIALLSVKIVSLLSTSPHWNSEWQFRDFYDTKMNRLVGVLDTSDETLRIVDGYSRRLESQTGDSETPDAPFWDSSAGNTVEEIKHEILDLLLKNTKLNSNAPNIAHMLLGYDVRNRGDQAELKSLTAENSGRAALHVTLLLLDPERGGREFSLEHPRLSEKCYTLIQQLCQRSYTSTCTSRYLRSQEDFFNSQLQGLPFSFPASEMGSRGLIQRSDGLRIKTSCAAVTSMLHSQASLMDSVGLEVHSLLQQKNQQKASQIVSALLSNFSSSKTNDFDLSRGFDQNECRMLETFYSLDFTWEDEISVPAVNSPVLSALPYQSTIQKDTSGCQIYDIKAIIDLIQTSQRGMQQSGMLSETQIDDFKNEARSVLLWFSVENNRLQIEFARLHVLKAWCNLLDVCLVLAFDLVEPAQRRRLLLELLATVLPPLSKPQTTPAQAEVLSGASVVIIARLRDEKDVARTFNSNLGEAVEKLHGLLRQTLRSICQPGVSSLVRGNLYTVLLNFFSFSSGFTSSQVDKKAAYNDLMLDRNGSMVDDHSMDGMSAISSVLSKNKQQTSLHDGNLSVLSSYLDRTVLTICGDAMGAPEVWQAVGFATLDVLSGLATDSRSASKVVSILIQHGELQNLVLSLKESEADLMDVLTPEPSSLNALYTYEAKMSFLTQLSGSRPSALKLIDAKVIHLLANCEYLNLPASFEGLDSMQDMEFDTFLPSVAEVQHQLTLPALQLVVNLVANVGHDATTCISQAKDYITARHDVMVQCLKSATATPSMAVLQETKLIIALLWLVAQYSPDTDFFSPSGFGGTYAAVRSFCATICSNDNIVDSVQPSNEAEAARARLDIITFEGVRSAFGTECVGLLDSLALSLLSFLISVTRPGSTMHPIFDATFSVTGRGHFPTLFHIANFSERMASLLSVRVEHVIEIYRRLEHVDDVGIMELEEYLLPSDFDQQEADRRQIAKVNLDKVLPDAKAKAIVSLHTVEMSLLVFWRHLNYYLSGKESATLSNDVPSQARLEPRIQGDTQTIRNSARRYIERISNILTPKLMNEQLREYLGLETRSHQAMIESLWRNCNEILNGPERDGFAA